LCKLKGVSQNLPEIPSIFLILLSPFISPECEKNAEQESQSDNLKAWVLGILAVSLLGIGIGQTAIATLGIPYIDDNVKSKQSPLYMAITIGVRVLGPALGYYLGSVCMRLYVDPMKDVHHTDAKFIGAWWLGKLIEGKQPKPVVTRFKTVSRETNSRR
jgi:MFS family permease